MGKKGNQCTFADRIFFARKDEFSFSEVYIHLLNKRKMDVLNKLDLQGAVVYWIVWGMDLYNKLLVPKGFPY